VTLGAKVGVKN